MKSSVLFLVSVFSFCVATTSQAQKTKILVNQGELPKTAQSFIAEHFSNYTFDYAVKARKWLSVEYEVKFRERLEIEFDEQGNWTEVDGKENAIPTTFIQKNILAFASDKFPNTQVIKIEKGRLGRQEVKLSNSLELEFDSPGNFLRIDD